MQKYLLTRFALILLVILSIKFINSRRATIYSDDHGESYTTCEVSLPLDRTTDISTISTSQLRTDSLKSIASTSTTDLTGEDSRRQDMGSAQSGCQTVVASTRTSEYSLAKDAGAHSMTENSNSPKEAKRPKTTPQNKGVMVSHNPLRTFTQYYQFASHRLPHPRLAKGTKLRQIATIYRI